MDTPPLELIYSIAFCCIFLERLVSLMPIRTFDLHLANYSETSTYYPQGVWRNISAIWHQIASAWSHVVGLLSKLQDQATNITAAARNSQSLQKQREMRTEISAMKIEFQDQLAEATSKELQLVRSGFLHEINNALSLVSGVVSPLKEDLRDLASRPLDAHSGELLAEANQLVEALDQGANRALRSTSNLAQILPNPRRKNPSQMDLAEFLAYKRSWYAVSFPEVRFTFHLEHTTTLPGLRGILIILDHLLSMAFQEVEAVVNPHIYLGVMGGADGLTFMISYNGGTSTIATQKWSTETISSLANDYSWQWEVNENPDGNNTTLLSFDVRG